MSLPFRTEAGRPDGAPEAACVWPPFEPMPVVNLQVVEEEQRFFVEWEVPEAS